MPIAAEAKKLLEDLAAKGLSKEVVDAFSAALESNEAAGEYLKGSVLRQSDFDRNLEKMKSEQAANLQRLEADIAGRYQASLDAAQSLQDAWSASKNTYDSLARNLAEQMKSNGNGGADTIEDDPAAKVAKAIDDLRSAMVTRADLEKLKKETQDELLQKYNTELRPLAVAESAEWAELAMKHQTEFMEPLDRKAFIESVRASTAAGVVYRDLGRAYNDWVRDRRTQLDTDKRIKEAVTLNAAKVIQDERARNAQRGIQVPGTYPQNGSGTAWMADKTKAATGANGNEANRPKFDADSYPMAAFIANNLRKQNKFEIALGNTQASTETE